MMASMDGPYTIQADYAHVTASLGPTIPLEFRYYHSNITPMNQCNQGLSVSVILQDISS